MARKSTETAPAALLPHRNSSLCIEFARTGRCRAAARCLHAHGAEELCADAEEGSSQVHAFFAESLASARAAHAAGEFEHALVRYRELSAMNSTALAAGTDAALLVETSAVLVDLGQYSEVCQRPLSTMPRTVHATSRCACAQAHLLRAVGAVEGGAEEVAALQALISLEETARLLSAGDHIVRAACLNLCSHVAPWAGLARNVRSPWCSFACAGA
eukprot:5314046-Prymnesium_polylepis.1